MGAYDAKTGKELWKFYTIPGPGDRFVDTWEGDSYKYGGGGVWHAATLDPDLGMLYLSTGNVGLRQYGAAERTPNFADEGKRGGDNLFIASIVALDMKTGAYRWHFQQIHHDIWHYDAGGPSVLADITYQGKPRKILMNPGKTGYVYFLDRTNGKPLIGIEERPVPQNPRMKTAPTQLYPIGDPFVPLCAEPLGTYERGCQERRGVVEVSDGRRGRRSRIAFEAAGEQYVAIMSGGNSVNRSQRGDFLWAFKLGGTLPQAPAPREPPSVEPAAPR